MRRWLHIALLLALALAPSARATTLVYLPDAQLYEMAGAVAVGRIVDLRTVVTQQAPMRVSTIARLHVDQWVKAPPEAPSDVEVITTGGQRGSLMTHRPGAARFTVGERVFVYLDFKDSGPMRVLALGRGKYRVEVDADGDDRVRLDVEGLTQIDPLTGRTIPGDLIPAARGQVYLQDLVDSLRGRAPDPNRLGSGPGPRRPRRRSVDASGPATSTIGRH